MSDFKAKMHQIRFPLWLRPRPRSGSLQRSPRWIWSFLICVSFLVSDCFVFQQDGAPAHRARESWHSRAIARTDTGFHTTRLMASELTGLKSCWLFYLECHAGESVPDTHCEYRRAETSAGSGVGRAGPKTYRWSYRTVATPSNAGLWLRHSRQMPRAYDVEGAYERWLQNMLNRR